MKCIKLQLGKDTTGNSFRRSARTLAFGAYKYQEQGMDIPEHLFPEAK